MQIFQRPPLKMNKQRKLNLGGIICLIAAVNLICYLLLQGILPFSISSITQSANHFAGHWRIMAVAFIPIYIAVMVFGTALLGVYLGSSLQRWFSQFVQKK